MRSSVTDWIDSTRFAGGELTSKVVDKDGTVHEVAPPIKEQLLAIEVLGRLGGMTTKLEVEVPETPIRIRVLGVA